MREDDTVAREIVDSAFAVHSALGPGLLESVYEQCLAYELQSRGHSLRSQVALPVRYRDVTIGEGYRMDMVVQGAVVVEIKAAAVILPIHQAQLLTYLKLSGIRVGLLINFNVVLIKSGIRRVMNGY